VSWKSASSSKAEARHDLADRLRTQGDNWGAWGVRLLNRLSFLLTVSINHTDTPWGFLPTFMGLFMKLKNCGNVSGFGRATIRQAACFLTVSLAVATPISFLSQAAHAAGYALLEQSAEGLGSGFAGSTAGYGDGSEVYFNPAAMSEISSMTASASMNLIAPRADFSNEGSTLGSAPIPLRGKNDETTETAVVPNVYVVAPVGDDVRIGLGVNSPFGLSTAYDADWVGRYHATQSELMTINISPAISYRAWDCECGGRAFSIGAAANVYYLDATLENAVDFGTIGFGALGAQEALRRGLTPQGSDGYAKVKGNDWATGFTLGGLYTYDDNRSSLGVSWHSRVQAELSGDAEFTVPSAARILQASGLFTDTDATAGVTLPESISVGGQHWINQDTALLYDAQWTRWSRFEELRVEFDSVQPDSVTKEGWDNVWRFSVGAKHLLNDAVTVRAGFTYDGSPVSDAEHRTPRIPDSNRYWLATGVSYALNDATSIDLSYAHIFVQDQSTNISSPTAGALKGNWDSSVDILALGVVTRW
jgi:long-chain fatty acid transport protein